MLLCFPASGCAESYASTTIDFPGAGETLANGINNVGQIIGRHRDSTGFHGYLLSGGSFITVDFPNGTFTNLLGINNAGQIVGIYNDDAGSSHGFLLRGDTFTTLAFRGALLTAAFGINDVGQIVGAYRESTNREHGFLLSGSSFTTLDFPGAVFGTDARGSNSAGQVVGHTRIPPGEDTASCSAGAASRRLTSLAPRSLTPTIS